MNYKNIIEQKRMLYKNAQLLAERDFNNLLTAHPVLNDLEYQIKQILIDKECGLKTNATQLKKLQTQRSDYLKKIGVSTSRFSAVPSCPKCNDTGYEKTKDLTQKICSCIVAAVAAATHSPAITFDNFDLSVFSAADKPSAQKVYDTALAFVKKFPHTNKLNLLFYGKTGTGKTFLANCIKDAIQKKGFSVIFTSAFNFLNKTLQYHTTFDAEKYSHIAPFLDCNLLIIDDLGTENMLKNVTIEYLYHILNERIQNGLHTIITTNLDDEEIKQRYDERIASRLFDKKLSIGFAISSNDLRKK